MRVLAIVEIDRAAPPAPRCFEARDIWVQFVASAAGIKPDARDGPLPFLPDGSWNPDFHPCTDCIADHEREMKRQKRCTRGDFTWTPPAVQASLNLESSDA